MVLVVVVSGGWNGHDNKSERWRKRECRCQSSLLAPFISSGNDQAASVINCACGRGFEEGAGDC